MVAHISFVRVEDGRELIAKGAVCAMKGTARDFWPRDVFDEELRALLEAEAEGARR